MNRTTKGALLGAGVGLLTGNGVNGVLKGAAVGAGVGAVTEKGRDGKMRVKVQKWVPPLVLSLAFWPAMASKGRLKVPWLAVRVVQFWVKWNKEWWWKICFTGGSVCFRTNDRRRTIILKRFAVRNLYYLRRSQRNGKTDSAQVAEIVAVMGNASVASRDLKIEQSPELSAKVVEKLNQVCAKDPQMLLITAIDDTMRAIGKNNI